MGSPPCTPTKGDFRPVGTGRFNSSACMSLSSVTLCGCQEPSLGIQEDAEVLLEARGRRDCSARSRQRPACPGKLSDVEPTSPVRAGRQALPPSAASARPSRSPGQSKRLHFALARWVGLLWAMQETRGGGTRGHLNVQQ